MMEVYGNTIDCVRNYNLDPKEAVKGLNRYYESDKRNGYITVIRNDLEGPAYFTAALYLSALIEWLREDHGIFYRPGLILDQVEAARSAAKMCCLRAHIKDEICKRGLWCGADADIPELVDTLFKAYDECVERANKNRADAVKLSKENGELRKEVKDIILQDTMNYIRQEASRNGFELPEEIDNEPLTVKRVFHDLLELLRMHETRIRNAERETRKAVNDHLKKDTDYTADALYDILEALGISKSDTVHLDIPRLKTKAIQRASVIKSEHDRYLEQLDKAEEEVKKLKEQKDRAAAILQDLYRDIFHKDCIQFTYENIANKILDKVLETEDLLHKSVDSVNKECKATGKLMVEDYKLKLKDYILKDIKEHGYRYDGLQKKSIEEIVDFIVTMATCPIDERAYYVIGTLRGQISRLKDLINAMNEEVGDM